MTTQQDYTEKSFWLGSRAYEPGEALKGTKKVDVAIIGGGFTGLTSAYFLKKAEPNLKVALLESQVIGFGASGRNAGFNMTLFGMTLSLTALRFGKARTKEAHLYMERAVDLLRDLVKDLDIDCDYEHPGFLRAATSEKYKKRILHDIEMASSLGISGIEWLEKDQLEREVRSPLFLGAWLEPRCGLLNPAKLAWGWRDVIVDLGAAVYENTAVSAIVRDSGKIRLETPEGVVIADKVILATNAYSHLLPGMKRKQIPAWTYIVLSEPLSEKHLNEIGWRGRQGIEDARNLVHYYRLTADNRFLMGGRDVAVSFGNDMEKDFNPQTFAELKQDVKEIFPVLKDISYTHQWGGPVSITLDMAPAMGYLGNKQMVYSVGCMGHGVSLTHLNGKTAADLILEKKTDLTEVFFVNRRTIPWPPEPIRLLARPYGVTCAWRTDSSIQSRRQSKHRHGRGRRM